MKEQGSISRTTREFVFDGAHGDPCFGFAVAPSRDESVEALTTQARRRNVNLVARAVTPDCEIRGWFLAPRNDEVRGIRAMLGDKPLVARRKQLRPDVHTDHPDRPDAIHSGFSLDATLALGWNRLELQYKNQEGRWKAFATCDVHLPYLWRIFQHLGRRASANSHEVWLRQVGDPTAEEVAAMQAHLEKFPRRPLLSVLMPVYNTPAKWLERAIESVRAQIYPDWELCIADDKSSDPEVSRVLQRFSTRDPRIKVSYRSENGHICHASNTALELCTGEFTVLLDHDDELASHALYHVAWEVANHPEVNIVFSDEDKIDANGVRSDPYFKPRWNYELLLSQNCVSHLGAFRTSLLHEIGGFRPGYEGSQDWDLTLRAVQKGGTRNVRHIPRVLYQWRMLPTSTASNMSAKPYASSAGFRAVADHLKHTAPGVSMVPQGDKYWQILWPLPDPEPLVTIVMPTRDQPHFLKDAAETLFAVTDYSRFELVIVDHESRCEETLAYLDHLTSTRTNVRRLRAGGVFNWSALSNQGAREARGEVVLFLNNDVSITSPEWLREMVRQAWRPDVGAVGACLLYDDGTIQHAGVVLNMTGMAGHVFRQGAPDVATIGGAPFMVREVTAVTGACMAVRREVFERAGGFDEAELAVSYNDVDFCLRLRHLGFRNIYTPFARLIHHESQSRRTMEATTARKAAATTEARVLLSRWPREFEGDSFFNPNLSLQSDIPATTVTHGPSWPWVGNSRLS